MLSSFYIISTYYFFFFIFSEDVSNITIIQVTLYKYRQIGLLIILSNVFLGVSSLGEKYCINIKTTTAKVDRAEQR